MKKNIITRILLGLLSVILALSPGVATATEPTNVGNNLTEEIVATYETIITPDMMSSNIVIPCADVDQSFTMSDSHRGGDRRYSGEYLRYSVTITDAYGNAVNDVISIKLWDYNHSTALLDNRVVANGITVTRLGIDIVPQRMYYFTYQKVSGNTSSFRVTMQITSYN